MNKRILSKEQKTEVDTQLYAGVVSRSTFVSIFLAFAFTVYGISSTELLQTFDATITIWTNTWPRLLFNGIPFILLSVFLKWSKFSVKLKSFTWAIATPMIFVSACCINAWPLIYMGKVQLYPYVHAANLFVFTIGLVVVAPPPKLTFVHTLMYITLFLIPVGFLLRNDPIILRFALNDFITAGAGSIITSHFTHKLRKKLATMNILIKSDISPFLGNSVTQAIYHDKLASLSDIKSFGLIMSLDIRGYTTFRQTYDKKIVSDFMKEYHSFLSMCVGKNGGFLHKSNGDGHIISFGVMDNESKLEEIPGIESELIDADTRRALYLVNNSVRVYEQIFHQFQNLLVKYDIANGLVVCGAVASGLVEVRIHGDESHKKEIDIDGDVIVKSARLESYTKVLMSQIDTNSSFFIITAELAKGVNHADLKIWNTKTQGQGVRDFSEIQEIFYIMKKLAAIKFGTAS